MALTRASRSANGQALSLGDSQGKSRVGSASAAARRRDHRTRPPAGPGCRRNRPGPTPPRPPGRCVRTIRAAADGEGCRTPAAGARATAAARRRPACWRGRRCRPVAPAGWPPWGCGSSPARRRSPHRDLLRGPRALPSPGGSGRGPCCISARIEVSGQSRPARASAVRASSRVVPADGEAQGPRAGRTWARARFGECRQHVRHVPAGVHAQQAGAQHDGAHPHQAGHRQDQPAARPRWWECRACGATIRAATAMALHRDAAADGADRGGRAGGEVDGVQAGGRAHPEARRRRRPCPGRCRSPAAPVMSTPSGPIAVSTPVLGEGMPSTPPWRTRVLAGGVDDVQRGLGRAEPRCRCRRRPPPRRGG